LVGSRLSEYSHVQDLPEFIHRGKLSVVLQGPVAAAASVAAPTVTVLEGSGSQYFAEGSQYFTQGSKYFAPGALEGATANTTPKDVTGPAKVTAPKVTAPKVTAPKVTAPKVTAPKVTTPKDVTPKDVTPKNVTPKDVTEPDKVTTPKE
jgi:hypothetical protein